MKKGAAWWLRPFTVYLSDRSERDFIVHVVAARS